jgi:hypothetical protein
MIKLRQILLLILLVPFCASAQNYGNEWINFSQKYFSFQVYETGWYRLDYATVNAEFINNGLNPAAISTEDYQVFGRDKEVPINVVDGGDGVLNAGDYIEFYAEKNDGWKDSLLFDNPDDMADAYYSFVNDTINYYLSVSNTGGGARIQAETDVNVASYPFASYCWEHNYVRHVTSSYNYGPLYYNLSAPTYNRGEGWTLGSFKINAKNTDINTKRAFSGVNAPNAFIKTSTSSASNPSVSGPYNHSFSLGYSTGPYVPLLDTSFFGYDLIKLQVEVDPATLDNGDTRVRESGINIGQGNNEKMFWSSASITYPHTFDFEGKSLMDVWIPNSLSSNKQSVTISAFNAVTPRLFIVNEGYKELPLVPNGANWDVVIPNNTINDSIQLIMIADENFINVSQIDGIGVNAQFQDLNSLDPSNAFLMITQSSLMPTSINYAAYRSSPAGGMHNAILIDVEELYHQFGGGIEKHPVAIRSFLRMAYGEWSTEPEHLFLIGKSIGNKADGSNGSREKVSSFTANLVPTWGYPGSDNHISQGLNGTGKSYAIPTGRISVNTNIDLLNYLDKVMQYEAQQDPNSSYTIANKEWQKNILHFNGCEDVIECSVIGGNFDLYKNIIEDTLFGGVVSTYVKDLNSTVLNSQDFFEVQQKLLDGVSLITFFGHASSGGGFSQNIDSPENWNNYGKYPLVIGLGCYTGDVHGSDTTTYADRIVRVKDEGAVAFVSTVKLGFLTNLGFYSSVLYDYLGAKNYYGSIGEGMKLATDSIHTLISAPYWNIPSESNYTGMSLQGDPALTLNIHNAPEIVLHEDRIWTEPALIDLTVDTFDLNIILTNIGQGFVQNFELSVERSFNGVIDSSFMVSRSQLMNRDTIVIRIPTKHSVASGLNTFIITVDLPFSVVNEHFDEVNNNQITFSTFIAANGVVPIWPYEYAIIPTDTITVKASTVNPFEVNTEYIFELDTTDLFNSPFKKTKSMFSIGGVLKVAPNEWLNNSGNSDSLVYTDSTVYFWRCSPNVLVKEWNESSFQYINGKWGWGQSHFFQYKKDNFQGIDFNRNTRTFDFIPNQAKVAVSNNVSFTNGSTSLWTGTNWSLSGTREDYGGWTTPSIMIAVIDGCDLKPWGTAYFNPSDSVIDCNDNHCYGQFNGDPAMCPGTNDMGRDRCHKFFVFRYNQADEMDSLVSMLNNKIPDGSYVVAYTYIPDIYTSPMNLNAAMPNSLVTAFQNLGSTNISNTDPDDGWIFFARKGFPSSALEVHSADTLGGGLDLEVQPISMEVIIQGCDLGYINSEIAGPAKNWNALYWKHDPLETPTSDSSRLKVFGLDYAHNQTLLIDTLLTLNDSILNLSTLVNPVNYPFIKLQGAFYDSVTFTASQMDRWQIIYEPFAELALNPKKGLYCADLDSIAEGDSASFAIAIENVSAFDMDSLLVKYWTTSSSGTISPIAYARQDSLNSGEVLLDTFKFPTNGLTALNYLWVTANPLITAFEQDQPEQYYFNNIAQKGFTVSGDNVNPLLDVTFDGVHILDRDLVSAKPEILITLDDENEFLLLDQAADTANFEVKLKRPGSNSYEIVYFMNGLGEEILKWYPAEDEKNKCQIEYNPQYTEDGIYTLQVQGRDKSNNFSGDFSYDISFEVVTASSVTHMFNYPNPFSTSTSFVFTLTGSELPDQMMIQIMTITGKVVKEIRMDELGPIRIGNNRTEYAWDGRDSFGDQLANGVYLYRVQATINGEPIDHRSTSADELSFKKGFGKMYLMR